MGVDVDGRETGARGGYALEEAVDLVLEAARIAQGAAAVEHVRDHGRSLLICPHQIVPKAARNQPFRSLEECGLVLQVSSHFAHLCLRWPLFLLRSHPSITVAIYVDL